MPRTYRNDLTAEYVKSILDYNPATGIFTWKESRGTAKKGQIAGKLHREYIEIKIDRVSYMAHRLAYLIMTGEWPKEQIDHRNTKDPNNKSNNSWPNIRPATSGENARNRRTQKNNKTGTAGVSWDKNHKKYEAYITFRGNRIRLGFFKKKEIAIKVRKEAELKYFGEFSKNEGV